MKTNQSNQTAPTQAPIITHVINTPLVNVYLTAAGYEMHLVAKSGQIIEHEPFKGDLEGLVSALSLAAEINAGKFYLSRMLQPIAAQPEQKQVLLQMPQPTQPRSVFRDVQPGDLDNGIDAYLDKLQAEACADLGAQPASAAIIDVQPTVKPAQPSQPAPTLKFSKPSTQPANGSGNGGTLNFRKGGA